MLERFLDGLRPGDPPDGQRYLRQAFAHYERQRVERDPKAHAELGVLANLEIGLHEQTRLQPQIREALDAAVRDPGGARACARSSRSSRRRGAGGRSCGGPAAAVVGVAGASAAARVERGSRAR